MLDYKKIRAKLISFCSLILLFRFYLVWLCDQIYEKGQLLNITSLAGLDKLLIIFKIISPVDYAVLLLFGFIMFLMLIFWFKKDNFLEIFNFLLSSNSRVYLFLVFLSLLIASAYFSPGIPYAGDSMGHVFGTWFVSKSIIERKPGLWTNYFWTGFPYLRYYGPLFYYLVGIVNLIFGNIIFSLKFILALCHIASGIFMFRLLYLLTRNRASSLIGAIGYVFTYFHYFQIAAIGRMRSSIFYLILPLLFYYTELFLQKRGPRNIILLGLLLGCLILTQPGYYSIFSFFLLYLYILVRCFTLWEYKFSQRINLLFKLSFSTGLGLALSSWIWFPMFIERIGKDLQTILSRNFFPLPAPSIKMLFTWGKDPFPNYYASYIGITIFILSLCGLLYILLNRNTIGVMFGLMYISTFFLIFGTGTRLYKNIPFIHITHSSGYFMLFLVFFLSILSGYGTEFLFGVAKKFNRVKMTMIIISALSLDLIPLSFQDNYPNRLLHQRDKIYEWLNSQTSKEKQVLILEDRGNLFSWLAPVYTNLPVITGPIFNVGTPCISKFVTYIVEKLKDESKSDDLSKFSKDSLFLLNVGYIISNSEKKIKGDLKKSVNFEEDIWIGELSESSPVVAAGEISIIDESLSYEEIIDRMGLDTSSRTCARILLYPNAYSFNYFNKRTNNEPALELLNHQIHNREVRLEVKVSSDGYLNLSYSYYPDIKVYIDKKRVGTIFRTGLGLICIPIAQGKHELVIKPGFSKLRKVFSGLSAGTFLLCCLFLFKRTHYT